jgi:hypothetical protein
MKLAVLVILFVISSVTATNTNLTQNHQLESCLCKCYQNISLPRPRRQADKQSTINGALYSLGVSLACVGTSFFGLGGNNIILK